MSIKVESNPTQSRLTLVCKYDPFPCYDELQLHATFLFSILFLSTH